MTFLKYAGDDYWWKWPEDELTVFNFNGGSHDINENSERFMNGTIIRAEDWHDLYVKTGYMALKVCKPVREMWISPEGDMYESEAHEVTAKRILEVIYGEKLKNNFWNCGDTLIERGWIKVTTSLMYRSYMLDGMYDNMTREQLLAWYNWHMKYMKDKN